MSQLQFKLQNKINELEARTAELETENKGLKEKINDMKFEMDLMKDISGYDEDEQKDAKIARFQREVADLGMANCGLEMAIHEKDNEIAFLKGIIAEKDSKIASLINDCTEEEVIEEFLKSLDNPIQEEESNEKMGEDVGEGVGNVDEEGEVVDNSPKKRVRVYKYTKPEGMKGVKNVDKKTGNRKYTSKRKPVTNRTVLNVLKKMYKKRENMTRFPGHGHNYNGVYYAQYFGRLNKAGDFGKLKTIILSSDQKVYQLNENDKHVELKWQNDKSVLLPSFGTINLIGEGKNYQCSLKDVFKTELGLFL